jgi:predicted O-methyltransferase YrrM
VPPPSELWPTRVSLAREKLRRAGPDDRVEIHQGEAADTLPALPGPFDLVFFRLGRAGAADSFLARAPEGSGVRADKEGTA